MNRDDVHERGIDLYAENSVNMDDVHERGIAL